MPQIRPVSELRNNFAEISRIVHEVKEPVFLTKNGYGDMVVMSVEQYDEIRLEKRIAAALKEAEREADATQIRYDFDEVSTAMRRKLTDRAAKNNG